MDSTAGLIKQKKELVSSNIGTFELSSQRNKRRRKKIVNKA